ncbi:Zinc finger CCCH domain-containing protein 12 [Chlorella vulgaris]
MNDQTVEEATRLGVLERLLAGPASCEQLASSLGISERVVANLMDRLVNQGVAEEVHSSTGGLSAFRLSQQRRRGRSGSSAQSKPGGRPGSLHVHTNQGSPQQHPHMTAVLPYGYGPYGHGQQVIYYSPAGLGPYQQQAMGGMQGHPQWQQHHAMQAAQRQQHGAGVGPGMQMASLPPQQQPPQPQQQQHVTGFTMQPFYYAAGTGVGASIAGAPPPVTPTVSGRSAMPRAGSGSTTSVGSTGWGGVPLSQPAAAAAAAPVMSQPSSQQELTVSGSSQELPSTFSMGASGSIGDNQEGTAAVITSGLAALRLTPAAGGPRQPLQQQPPQQQQQADEGTEASQPDPVSSEEGSEPGADGLPPAVRAAGNSSSAGGHGNANGSDEAGPAALRREGSSSGGSSGGSRRSRASRERQPCAFFLKTGTCAYGDGCKFAHPFDQAPKVLFNSLGLPLRPTEPECSFFMKNFRCAFGHTCKFHHPELPPGGGAAPPLPPMYAMQYAMQYQSSSPPMLASVLGLKPGSSGGPGTPLAAQHGGGAPAGYYVTSPHFPGAPQGGFGGRQGLHQQCFAPHAAGSAAYRGPPQRSYSGNSGRSSAGGAAASQVPLPLPLPLQMRAQAASPTASVPGAAHQRGSAFDSEQHQQAAVAATEDASSNPQQQPANRATISPREGMQGEHGLGVEQEFVVSGTPAAVTAPLLPSPFRDAPLIKRAGGVLKDKHGKYRTLYDQRARTTVLINVAGILERCNEQTLPALYKYIGRSFKASPRQLGFVTLACALVQAVCAPIGGLVGHYANRAHVMAAGCFIWGAMATCFAFTRTLTHGMIFWAFNGVGLGLLLPNAQSLIADYFSALSRGKAFGAYYLCGALGGTLGALFATNMGHTQPWGMEGWRVAFIAVGCVSLLIGVLNLLFAVDPRVKLEDPQYRQAPDLMAVVTPRAMLEDVSQVLAVPSFVIVVTQGVIGSLPWNALVFNTYYLQLLGFSDVQSSLLGGFIGDWAAKRYPNHGRVAVAQVSVALSVPLAVSVFKALPVGNSAGVVALYGAAFTVWGLMSSWAGSACTSPVLAEVVASQLRSVVYSFDRAFEGAVAACGAPIVGWLAERLGFAREGGGDQTDMQRAEALGDAIVICTAVPWALCCLLFSGLHVTYARDRRLALRSQRTRSGQAASLQLLPTLPSADELWEQTSSGSPQAAPQDAYATPPAAAAAPPMGRRVSFAEDRPSV